MNHNRNGRYLAAGLTAFAVIAASLLLFFLLFHAQDVGIFLTGLAVILRPIFMGAVIAFLLLPVYRAILRVLTAMALNTRMRSQRDTAFLNIVAVILSLLLAFFLGRIFCGWICPYGFFSELAYALHQTASGSVPAISPGRFARSRFAERLSRLLVLLLALLCTLAAGFPLLHIISMPGNISLSPLLVRIGAGFSGMIAALALLSVPFVAVEALIGKRLWCRYVCPQSLLLGAAALPASKLHVGFRVEWRKEACTCRNGSPCGAACSMGLHPRAPGGPSRLDCTMCGDCIRICSSRGGALRWKWGRSAHR